MIDIGLFNEVFKGKRVLITGNTGFKGSWLTIWLLELGAEVYGYALPPKTGRDNFVVTKLAEKIHHQDGDIRDLESLRGCFQQIQPEFAFHLAAQPLVLESYRNPHETFETNILGTVNFFEAVRSTDSVQVAINITSDKCYQNNEWVWGYRENDPLGGLDPYSASKGCAELITTAYRKSFFHNSACKIASVRAGNVIGGGDWAENRIVPDFFRSIIDDRPLMLRNPDAVRPWQHVLEPLGGYLVLCQNLFEEGQTYSGAWNFGPPGYVNYSVLDLINSIKSFYGKGEYILEKNSEKPHEANYLKLDISKAANLLGWSPVLNFSETVELTVEAYHSDLKMNDAYSQRIHQIQAYLEKAKDLNVRWAAK